MVALAGEIAQGAVWANAARSHMAGLARPSARRRAPGSEASSSATWCRPCIDADRAAAAAVNRKTLTGYVKLPNYQNYWIEAGFEEEMQAIRKAIAAGEEDAHPLRSCPTAGSPTSPSTAAPREVRDGIEAWHAAGVNTLIVVPSSTQGNQMVALQELIDLYR